MSFSVLTINIAGLQFGWFEKRRDALVQQLKTINPDIVFLQETIVSPEKNYDQTRDIQHELGLSACAFTPYGNEAEYESPRLGGVGILSRWPFLFVENRKFPRSVEKYGARSGLLTGVKIEGREILLGTTHLSYRKDEEELRLAQTKEFLRAIEQAHFAQAIIGGDFNAVKDEPAIQIMEEKFLTAPAEGNTFKNRQIDYLFSTPEINLLDSKIVQLESDHNGVLATYSVQIL